MTLRTLCLFVATIAASTFARAQDGPGLGPDPGFIRVVESEGGRLVRLEMGVREYRRADASGPVLTVAGAVHIGEAEFYRRLQEILDAKDVVLYESVRPSGAGRDRPLDDEARAKYTERRLRFLATAIDAALRAGASPADLPDVNGVARWHAERGSGAIGELVAGSTTDAWGGPITLAWTDQEGKAFDLVSLGSDAGPQGEGLAADLRWSEQKPLSRAERQAIGSGKEGGLQAQLAEALDLVFQLNAMSHDAPNWRNSDLSMDEVQDRLEAADADAGMLFKVLDGSSISAKLVGMLVRLIGLTETTRSMTKLMVVEMLGQADLVLEAQMGMEAMLKVIIEDRNQVVIDDLRAIIETEPEIKEIGIIYGAGHLPDLTRRLADLGYQPGPVEWIRAIEVDVQAAGLSVAQARDIRESMAKALKRQVEAARDR